MPTNGRASAAKTSVTSAPDVNTAKQRVQVIAELDHLIGGDRKASTTNQITENIVVSATYAKSSKVTDLEAAQSQVTDAQRTLELLTSAATEKKIDADNKKTFYFKAHARALELAIDREATIIDLNSACDDAGV